MLTTGTMLVGGTYLAFAAVPTLALACVAAVAGGVGNGLQWAPVLGGVQRLTPHALQARVMGALEALGAIAPAVGFALGGALVALTDPRVAFVVTGACACLTTFWFARVPLKRPAVGAGDPTASRPGPGAVHDGVAGRPSDTAQTN
jgi:hypothetical protein